MLFPLKHDPVMLVGVEWKYTILNPLNPSGAVPVKDFNVLGKWTTEILVPRKAPVSMVSTTGKSSPIFPLYLDV